MLKNESWEAGSLERGQGPRPRLHGFNVAHLNKSNRQTPQVKLLQPAENKDRKFF